MKRGVPLFTFPLAFGAKGQPLAYGRNSGKITNTNRFRFKVKLNFFCTTSNRSLQIMLNYLKRMYVLLTGIYHIKQIFYNQNNELKELRGGFNPTWQDSHQTIRFQELQVLY